MAFKMKGNPYKMGGIKGTAGHVSALKQATGKLTKEESLKEKKSKFEKQAEEEGGKVKSRFETQTVKEGKGKSKFETQAQKEGKAKSPAEMKSPMQQKEDSEKVREAYYQEELKKLQADPDIGDPDPKQDEKDARKAAEERYYKEKTKSPAEMKSPLEQTSFLDKVRSGGKALIAGLDAESTGPHDNIISTVSDAYKKYKKEYRDEDKKQKRIDMMEKLLKDVKIPIIGDKK